MNSPANHRYECDCGAVWFEDEPGRVPCPTCKTLVGDPPPRDRNADRIDGYDRDDLGESPDY